MDRSTLGQAFYRHPALLPHRLLKHAGVSNFILRNAMVTAVCMIGLTAFAYADRSFFRYGYGYLEYPGVIGWFAIQLFMPVAIFRIVVESVRNQAHFRAIENFSPDFDFDREIFKPIVRFIGMESSESRSLFSSLFAIGLGGFAWNTFQNLKPGVLVPLDFWDSIHFTYGYFGSRAYKFYMHVHSWHLASIRTHALNGRYRDEADIGRNWR